MIDLEQLWWEPEEPKKRFERLISQIGVVKDYSADRNVLNLHHARLYSAKMFNDLTAFGYSVPGAVAARSKPRLHLNIISNIVDTAVARIAKSKPKVTFVTDGGDFEAQTRAKKLDEWVLGSFSRMDLYKKGQEAFRDCCVLDVGVVHFFRDDANEIQAERVLSSELHVDPADAAYGSPTCLYRIRYFPKSILRSKFLKDDPKAKLYGQKLEDVIEKGTSEVEGHTTGRHHDKSKMVMVIEAWHLPSGPEAQDGRYVMSTTAGILFESKYTKDYFPFAFMRWSRPLVGFWGQSLAERLSPIQLEINGIVRDLQYSRQFFAVPWIGIETGSKVKRADINNIVAHLVDYNVTPPNFMTPPMAHSQWFDWLNMLINQAYEIAGVSKLSATSKKPSGLDAAVALREYQDIESERFAIISQEFDNFYLTAAHIVIDLARDIVEDDGSYTVKLEGKEFIEELDFAEVDMERDQYVMKMFPTSMLPQHPAARMQQLAEWEARGYITQEEMMQLSEFPDLKHKVQLTSANQYLVEKQVSKILHDGEYIPPMDDQDLNYTLKTAVATKLRAVASGAPDENIAILQQFIDEVNAKLKIQQPPMPAEGEAPAAPPADQPLPQEMPGMG
jgi:hypothetical protein